MKKKIIISAINIFEGGALSILKDCLFYLDNNLIDEYDIIVYVHNSKLIQTKNITLIEIPKSRKSYFNRLFYEYVWFYFQSLKLKPYLWFSLHDITPNVYADIRAVYCHNPSPFYKISLSEFLIEPSFGFFNLLYKYLYKINLNNNRYIVVQQKWLREKFRQNLNSKSEIIVAIPNIIVTDINDKIIVNKNKKKIFIYPTFPRVFKNIECACEATRILSHINLEFEMHITISGNENKYSKQLFDRYKNVSQIKFLGRLKREEVFLLYQQCDALVFPSKLETWGLPISEAKVFHKPILVADLPYAYETVGNYDRVTFFNPDNCMQLAEMMQLIITDKIVFEGNNLKTISQPTSNNWEELFNILLR